jgi:hypothetical protein
MLKASLMNSAFYVIKKPLLDVFCFYKVQKLPAPIDFPHDDPDPCAGYSLTESFIVLIF